MTAVAPSFTEWQATRLPPNPRRDARNTLHWLHAATHTLRWMLAYRIRSRLVDLGPHHGRAH